ncbi:hypothetical protein QZG57_07840 [Corynebacterium glucuronolyticum]|uniref:hypothetical protein n=1 Tax=Corynebacterium glucuronolyticum TaxID=39791 RepID=UPI003F6DF4E3
MRIFLSWLPFLVLVIYLFTRPDYGWLLFVALAAIIVSEIVNWRDRRDGYDPLRGSFNGGPVTDEQIKKVRQLREKDPKISIPEALNRVTGE